MVDRLDDATIARLQLARYTYLPVGGTATLGHAPGGHRWLQRTAPVGCSWDEAVDALMSWRVHERAGLRVRASSPRVVPDAVVLMSLRAGPFRVPGVEIPCRVVRVIDGPDRAGFAYGTLPGHPEAGEEEFLLTRDGDQVGFTITAFSRPASRLARTLGPLGRLAQDVYTWRYLTAL